MKIISPSYTVVKKIMAERGKKVAFEWEIVFTFSWKVNTRLHPTVGGVHYACSKK